MDTGKPYIIRCSSCRTPNRIAGERINDHPICGKCQIPLNLSEVFKSPVDATDASFENVVVKSPIPVFLIFWAAWCSACHSVLPIVERIATHLKGRIRVVKVNADQNPYLASRFQVKSVPLLMILDNGKVKESILGAESELNILRKHAPYY